MIYTGIYIKKSSDCIKIFTVNYRLSIKNSILLLVLLLCIFESTVAYSTLMTIYLPGEILCSNVL